MTAMPHVLIACNAHVREGYLDPVQLERLEKFARWSWFESDGGGIYDANTDPADTARLAGQMGDVDALVLCHGAPRIGPPILEQAPRLGFVGELEGDRFASRMDLDAIWGRDILAIDTTNGSSYPVSEWALGLILISLRNAGSHFRRMVAGEPARDPAEIGRMLGVLTGKRVGLIGGGHMGRRLIKLLRPFETEIWVHDPYLPVEMAEALDFTLTSLENILTRCDVIVCVAPLTPGTRGMIGQRELDLIPAGRVFVNVSRGPIVDSSALIARLQRGDIFAGLDVFDPEPVPEESKIRQLPNVFLSPHIGYYGGATYPSFFQLMVDDLERFFHGHQVHFGLTQRTKANRLG